MRWEGASGRLWSAVRAATPEARSRDARWQRWTTLCALAAAVAALGLSPLAALALPPIAEAGGPYFVNLGSAVTLDGSGSSDPEAQALTYDWEFGDGATGSGVAPTHTYTTGGFFTITLTVTDPEPLSATDTATIEVNRPPEADAGGPYSGVAGASIQVDGTGSSDLDGDSIVSFAWDFGDGGAGSGPTPSHTYTAGGDYTVTLTVTDEHGLTDTASTSAAINEPPTASAGGPYFVNLGSPITLDGSGSSDPDGTIVDYSWEFGDETTGSGVAPTHTYTTGGPFTITLTVTDDGGLTDTDATSIEVNRPPQASAGGPYSGNAGASIQFDGTGSSDPDGDSIVSFAWDFGDGSSGSGPTPSHTYAARGDYTVTLTVTDEHGLTDTASATASINGPPVADPGGPYFANLGDAISFDGTGSSDPDGDSLTYLWEFGDGSTASGPTPSHTYAVGGEYTVTLTVTDPGSLSDAATTLARVNRPPTANAGGPYLAGSGGGVTFDGSGSSDPDGDLLTYFWEFGDGQTGNGVSPSHTYAAGGVYTVTLTVTDAGSLTDADGTTARFNTAPVADAGGPYSGNPGDTITFDGTGSSDPEGDPISYFWEFGDGQTATGATPTHAYTVGGGYTVTLTVSDDLGAAGVDTAPADINRPPIPDPGGPYTGNEGESIQFDGTGSSDPDGDALSYLWEFGDGTTATGATPTHVYASSGIYTVTLSVTDPGNLSAAAQTTTTVNGPPIADAGGPYVGDVGSPVQFDGTGSFDPDGDTLVYEWQFGDGALGSGPTPTHTYVTHGPFTVTLTVRDPDTLEGVDVTSATINAAPIADPGGPYAGNEGQSIQFDGSGSFDPDGDTLVYTWAFGDGQQATGVAPTHTYLVGGVYTVTLRVADPRGLFDEASTSATINRTPISDPGGPYSGNEGQPIEFDGTGSSDPENQPLTYAWQFGDGTTGSGATPIHVYASGAVTPFTVTLTVTDPAGLSSAATTTADVNQTPIAVAGGPYSGNAGQPVTFDGSSSSDPDGDQLAYLWQFGDGQTGTGPTPQHVYAAGGAASYTVTLTVTDPGGLTDASTTTASVNRAPSADAGGPYAVDRGVTLTLDGSGSSDPDGDTLIFRWEFGDGALIEASGLVNPQHSYEAGGTYTITLTVRDRETAGAGLTDVDVAQVVVNDITVSSPGGGAVWSEGSAQNIRWTIEGSVERVRIQYRTDPAASWQTIANDVDATAGVFNWDPVASVAADAPQARVRVVRPATPPHASDLIGLSQPFTILNRVLTVTSPPPGTQIFETESLAIQWTTVGFVPRVNLEYRLGGTSDWMAIAGAQNIVNNGSFQWSVPEVSTDHLDSSVRVVGAADGETVGTSGGFDILNRGVRIVRPASSDVWSEASTQLIQWQTTGPVTRVRIDYRIGSTGAWVEIDRIAALAEAYSWTLPPVSMDAPGSRVRLVETSGSMPESDESDDFVIQNRVIQVSQPPTGLEISERTETSIVWSSAGFVDAVRLEYTLDGASWTLIANQVPNSGSYVWETPEVVGDQSAVQVRVTDSNPDADLARGASGVFTIVDRVILPISPPFGAAWCEADTVSIVWNSRGRVPRVDIDWRPDNQSAWQMIVAGLDNVGSLAWTTPDLAATAAAAQIRIRGSEDPTVQALTGEFTISDRELELLTPVAGSILSEGDGALVSWSQICIDSVFVFVRIEDGAPWVFQGSWNAELGQILWPVPPVDQNRMGVRVRITDDRLNPNLESISGAFTILNKTLALIRPTVTDTLSEAQPFTIEWDWEGTLPQVDLDFRFTDEVVWQPIAIELTNTGTHDWVLPLVDEDREAQVRVSDPFGPLTDVGQPFAIVNRAITVTRPAAGDSLSEAATTTIEWRTRGLVPSVHIEYRPSSTAAWQVVVSDLPNGGSYGWTVPEVTSDQLAAQVRVVDVTTLDVAGESAPFAIIDRSFAFGSPAGGETWSEATEQLIQWTWSGAIDSVALDYRLEPAAAWLPIVSSIPNDGDFLWLLPEVDRAYDAAAVRITARNDPGLQSVSPSYVHVDRAIAIEAPAPEPRSEWRIGDSRVVAWSTTGFIETVDVELSRTGTAGSFETLAAGVANTGAWAWQVTEPETYDAIFRIRDAGTSDAVSVSPFPVALYDLIPPALCGDYNHDDVTDLDEVMRVESIIVGRVAASEADSINFDCHADRLIELNDLIGAVDAHVEGLAAGRGRTAGGRFVDGGPSAPVTVALGEPGPNAGGRQLALTIDAAAPVAGFLVEIEVDGARASPRLADELTGDVTLAWTPVAGRASLVASLRCQWRADGAGGFEAVELGSQPLIIDLIPDGSGEVTLRLKRAEAYGDDLMPLPVHLGRASQALAPAALTLAQNIPNPFNPSTVIRFGVPVPGRVRVDIYDVRGRLVRRLVDDVRAAGFYAVRWDGRDERGVQAASGVYLCTLEAGGARDQRKMTLLR